MGGVAGVVQQDSAAGDSAFETPERVMKWVSSLPDRETFQSIVEIVHANRFRGNPVRLAAARGDFEKLFRIHGGAAELVREFGLTSGVYALPDAFIERCGVFAKRLARLKFGAMAQEEKHALQQQDRKRGKNRSGGDRGAQAKRTFEKEKRKQPSEGVERKVEQTGAGNLMIGDAHGVAGRRLRTDNGVGDAHHFEEIPMAERHNGCGKFEEATEERGQSPANVFRKRKRTAPRPRKERSQRTDQESQENRGHGGAELFYPGCCVA